MNHNSIWRYSDRMIQKMDMERMTKAKAIKSKGPWAVIDSAKAGAYEPNKSEYYNNGLHFTEIEPA